jgi:hypothetical protein
MNVQYEWQLSDSPDGLVSVVVRMSIEEATALVAVDLKDPAQPDVDASQSTQRQLIETLQQAVVDGQLILPAGG